MGISAKATLRLKTGGVKLLVDPMSYQYLVGAEIDYTGAWKARSLSSATLMPPPVVVGRLSLFSGR